ncbi:hypothetical protein [Agromyces humi]|uniref:hypothetical protein n=1 Tax=Agromyces humi TaxID=1766800 RepID=UPI00135708B9|nr:hypothetical protein [Agromyces humi]
MAGVWICGILTLLSAAMWASALGTTGEAGGVAPGGVITVVLAGLTLILWFRARWKNAGEEAPAKPTRTGILLGVAAVTAILAGVVSFIPGYLHDAMAGSQAFQVSGPTSGEAEYVGAWALKDGVVTVETTSWPTTTVEVALEAGSSAPSFDLTLTMDDATTVECSSEKRVNWDQLADRTVFTAYCSEIIQADDMDDISGVTISDGD